MFVDSYLITVSNNLGLIYIIKSVLIKISLLLLQICGIRANLRYGHGRCERNKIVFAVFSLDINLEQDLS